MDPNQIYLDVFNAMQQGDHPTARRLAIALRDWLDRGGKYPFHHPPKAMDAYLASVLCCTAYLS